MTSTLTAEILGGSRAILLDFDGPVCSIFACLPDFDVSERLRNVLRQHDIDYPPAVEREHDPLQVLRFASTTGKPGVLEDVEHEFRKAEVAAAASALPTAFALDFISAAVLAGKALAIVSNNSAEAILAYLEGSGFVHMVPIFGRPFAAPHLMKPHPHLVEQALAYLGCTPHETVLIGDSVTDIEVSKAVGMASIGFANLASKEVALAEAGADAIVVGANGMRAMAAAIGVPESTTDT